MGKIVIPEIFKDPNAIVTLTVGSRTVLKQKAIQRVDKLENFQAQYQFFDTYKLWIGLTGNKYKNRTCVALRMFGF